jgi:hypothetical protein
MFCLVYDTKGVAIVLHIYSADAENTGATGS